MAASHRVLRTVYLPSANADALQLKVESLQAQLSEHKQLTAERIAALMQDRALREEVRSCSDLTLAPASRAGNMCFYRP